MIRFGPFTIAKKWNWRTFLAIKGSQYWRVFTLVCQVRPVRPVRQVRWTTPNGWWMMIFKWKRPAEAHLEPTKSSPNCCYFSALVLTATVDWHLQELLVLKENTDLILKDLGESLTIRHLMAQLQLNLGWSGRQIMKQWLVARCLTTKQKWLS